MAGLRSTNIFSGAARLQTLRVIVVPPDPTGVYSFVADQDCTLDAVIFAGLEMASARRYFFVHVDGVEVATLYLPAGQVSASAAPSVAIANGETVRATIRGASATTAGATLHCTGAIETQYRLTQSQPAPAVWQMIGGVWTPARATYRFTGTERPEAETYLRTGSTWNYTAD